MGKYVKMHAMETKPLRQHFPGRSPPNACDEGTTLFLFPGRSPPPPVQCPRPSAGNKGVTVVYETVGSPLLEAALKCVKWGGARALRASRWGGSNRSAGRVTYSVLPPPQRCRASKVTEFPRLRKADWFSYHDVCLLVLSILLRASRGFHPLQNLKPLSRYTEIEG